MKPFMAALVLLAISCNGSKSTKPAASADATPAAAGPDAAATPATATADAAPTGELPGTHPANRIVPSSHGPCTAAEVKTARAAAKKLMDAKDYKGAKELLSTLTMSCDLDPGENEKPNLDYFWVYSDLSYAALKAGDYVECLQIVAPLTTPKPPTGLDWFEFGDSKVATAILHNEAQCQKAYDAQMKDFVHTACSIELDTEATLGLPADLLPAGATAGCLALLGGAEYDQFQAALEGDTEDRKLCPNVVLIVKTPGAAEPTRKTLTDDGGRLADTSNCCNLSALSMAVRDGKRLIRFTGEGRDCFGGSAYMNYDAVYEWKGDQLIGGDDNSITSH